MSICGVSDKLVWWPAKNGFFLVKSAYYLEMQERDSTQGEPSNQTNDKVFWRAIWGLNIKGVVKNFLWRACHNSLPSKLNLFKRKILTSSTCPTCNFEEESITHTLWECPVANKVWGEKDSPLNKWATNTSNFRNLWADIMHSQTSSNQALCAVIFHNLWLRMNAYIFEQKFSCPK